MTVLVTGGAGFIGANFILEWFRNVDEDIVNVDKLTYAGNLGSLTSLRNDERHVFSQTDIRDSGAIRVLLATHKPRAIVHFAAESHVDRSIHGPAEFISTNVVGTSALLDETRRYCESLPANLRDSFRFINVSTDEVFGSLSPDDAPATELSPYRPNSPYAASKAAADHLVRSYHHTFGLPVITTNCSNNYGPYQFPEKLIPLMILNGLHGRALPVYGDGMNVRDWLYVSDHCTALRAILDNGRPGETYNIGGNSELTNLDVVRQLCALLDELAPITAGTNCSELITHVPDRPGHDRRYAIDTGKMQRELGWLPSESFASGLRKTVEWYLANNDWIAGIESGRYREWIETNYGNRAAAL